MADIRNPYANLGRYSADLCLFLLVARSGQLSAAAREAGLSQPRLSQRMRALEDSLGRRLLVRERRGVSLSPDGVALMAALNGPLTEAADAFDRYCRERGRAEVVILTDIAFASFLLLPEFASLNAAFPGVAISVLTRQMPDPREVPGADLVIRMEDCSAPGPAFGSGDVLLFRETVSAVCSPDYAARHPGMRAADLPGGTFIDLAAREDAPWYSLRQWLAELGVDLGQRREVIAFNSFDHVIRAARSGLGVALCWEGLVDLDAPDAGLVRAVPERLQSRRGYVLRAVSGRSNPDAGRVLHWLRQTFARG